MNMTMWLGKKKKVFKGADTLSRKKMSEYHDKVELDS